MKNSDRTAVKYVYKLYTYMYTYIHVNVCIHNVHVHVCMLYSKFDECYYKCIQCLYLWRCQLH